MVSIQGSPFVVGSGSVDRFGVTEDTAKYENVHSEIFDRNSQSWEVLQPFPAFTG